MALFSPDDEPSYAPVCWWRWLNRAPELSVGLISQEEGTATLLWLPYQCLKQILIGCACQVPTLVPIPGVKGERSILTGQTEDRYLPALGEVRAAPPESHIMEERVVLFLGEVGG